MEFAVFGRTRIRHDGRETGLAGSLQRVLLGVLLVRANSVVSADTLTDAMWGERPGSRAGANLHLHVHRLRRALPDPDRLTSEPGGYRLAVLPGELDAERFESLLDEGAEIGSGDPQRAAELIRKALSLWGGLPFDGTDTPLLACEAHRLAERRLAGMDALYTAELACGRHAAVIPELTEQVRSHPLHERMHALLMIALYRSGQQDRALAAARSARRLLIDELGQEPGPELRHIEERILNGQHIDLGAPQTDVRPAQLPHDVRGFTGRAKELSILDGLLVGDVPVRLATISGTGGVGKTALAVRWAHRVRERFPDGQLYVDLCGYGPEPPVSSQDALAGFLRELGVDSAAIPSEPAERAARFRTLVAGRRLLVVLDNAGTIEQLRPLLPGGSAGLVLVTSRDSLAGLVAREGAQRVPLDRLPRGEAFELLRELVGRRAEAETDASTRLIERCAQLPLALRIAAELINARPHPGIGELAEELADQQRTLDVLDAGGDLATAVRAVFSWSYRRLSPEAARAFRLIGLHPGYDIDVCAVAALTGGDLAVTRQVVDTLRRAHLLDETSAGRYQPHDLLRAYAVDLCRSVETDAERRAALASLFDHYLHTASITTDIVHDRIVPQSRPRQPGTTVAYGSAEAERAAGWLDAERANLVTIAQHATRSGQAHVATKLSTTLRRYLSLGGHHDQALAIYQAALDEARELGDLLGEGNAARCIGSVYRRLGRLPAAYEYMYRAYVSYQQADQRQYLQLQLNTLAVTCTWLGRCPDSRGYLRHSLQLADELGADGRIGRVGALTYLGQLHVCLGEPEKALGYATEALKHADERRPRERIDAEAMTGFAYDRLGRYEQARQHLELAWSMARDMRNHFMQGYLSSLAHVYWQLGLRDDAFGCVEHCLAVTRRTSEQTLEAGVRNTFGELHRLDGAYPDAFEQFRAARDIAEASHVPHDEARAHAGIGDTHESLGDVAEARAHWLRALDIYQGFGSADANRMRAKLTSTDDPGYPRQRAAAHEAGRNRAVSSTR